MKGQVKCTHTTYGRRRRHFFRICTVLSVFFFFSEWVSTILNRVENYNEIGSGICFKRREAKESLEYNIDFRGLTTVLF